MNKDFKLGDRILWVEAPPYIEVFGNTNIRGLSPCGRYALLNWIRHPVKLDDLKHVRGGHEARSGSNHWGIDNLDRSTGENWSQWVINHE